jgi:hypothetical protein
MSNVARRFTDHSTMPIWTRESLYGQSNIC